MFRCRFFAFSSILIFTSLALGQSLGSIAGKIVDAKKVPIPGATVKLSTSEPGPPLETISDFEGAFIFPDLPEGAYQLQVEMSGFQELKREVRPSTQPIIITLGRQSATPQMTSTPAQNGVTQPARDTPRNLDNGQSTQTPQPASNPQAAQAGRQPPNGPRPQNGQRFQEVALAGTNPGDEMQQSATPPASLGTPANLANGAVRDDNSDVLMISGNPVANLDSGDWNDPSFRNRMMDMAGQMGFNIDFQPGGFGGRGGDGSGGRGGDGGGGRGGGEGMRAAFGGGGPGGAGFRGGRQAKYNGSLTSTYQNSCFNARPYSLTGQQVSKPLKIQNNFGGQIGGQLPWGQSQTQAGGRGQRGGGGGGRGGGGQPGMWFFSYEGSRNRNPFSSLTTVPMELERSGDFSQTMLRSGPLAGKPIALYDPLASTPTLFTGGKIPSTRMNAASLAILKYYPLPNLPGSIQNFTMQRGLVNTSNTYSGRVNTRIGSKDNVGINYSLRSSDAISSAIFPGFDTDRTNRSQNLGLNGTHRFSARFIINYRINLNRVRSESFNPFAFNHDVEGQLGITGVSRDPINFGIPTVSMTNYGGLSLATPSLTRSQTITYGSGINKIGRKHTISAGGDLSWNQRNSRMDSNARGTYNFSGFATSAFDSKGHALSGTGYDFADFLLGFPYETSRRFGSANNYLRNRSLNLFVQENWRFRSNLTFNFGLRYELLLPFYEKYDHLVSLDVSKGFTAVAQVFPDTKGPYSGYFPRSLVNSDKNNLSPRVGIAWKPKPTSKWVFRTGYGLFYNPSVYPVIANQLIGQPPFATNQNILTTLSDLLTFQNGFPLNPDVTIRNSYAIDPNYRIGYVQQWNLNVQTTLFKIYTVEVGYNGTKGTRLDILRAPNRAPIGGSSGTTEDNRIISNAENFLYQSVGANSILHSMNVRVSRRFSHGFRTEQSYTRSKSIDNASGVGGGSLAVVQDDRNIGAERSLSSFDRRHTVGNEFSYDLPVGERRKYLSGAGPFLQQLVGGWTLFGNFTASSGSPSTARILGNVANNSGTGSNNSERADATGVPIGINNPTTTQYFNTLAFGIPAPGLFGNAGRNTISGPGSYSLNLNMRKSFRLDEKNRRVELRVQATNVLNHRNFSGLGTVVNSLTFGRVTGAGQMRQVEFNIRITF